MKFDFTGILAKGINWTKTVRPNRLALNATILVATGIATAQLTQLQDKFTQAGIHTPQISALLRQEHEVSSAAIEGTKKPQLEATQLARPSKGRNGPVQRYDA